ncbi:DEAD/DEAH box helicase [Paenibacillus sp. 19GGS1-52]|uniref:DNA repair helicase XPB n=1 Tax=Paenibacillus sp. 19GGS1-52 TaxID=2758563 RepID=UPI001EFB7CB9|nr:DNA repair helicase XPB [Paenibacillus sp. 19GGS1-52]ULO05419.1 DEAD/DEAH box helicase [Paenibacillus sp. 19GGS1-52]
MEKTGACIIRRDRTVLLECAHPGFEAARQLLATFAELIKSPTAFHTYRITPLSLWNAAALGYKAEHITTSLRSIARWNIPTGVMEEISLLMSRYGRLTLHTHERESQLITIRADTSELLDELEKHPGFYEAGLRRSGPVECVCRKTFRGQLKQELTRLGYPIMDYAGYHEGQALNVAWREPEYNFHDRTEADGEAGTSISLREYQREAVQHFQGTGGTGGSGVVVLPCGAGKTVVGIAVLESLQCETLILTSSTTSVRQWMNELLQRTNLDGEAIGEYSGEKRQVRPVTVATYQILTHRRRKEGPFIHINLFNERNWGLIIYDEVHLLPAPVFRATADIQATRRLGLTATLVREDGREDDVFSLIGPKCYDLPWKVLEKQGWIATVECIEMTVPMNVVLTREYMYAENKEKFRLAAGNPGKIDVVLELLEAHRGSSVLVIGQYLDQLSQLAEAIKAPLITGKTSEQVRGELYAAFNAGRLQVLIVSKVANFALDLPDASVAIEVSGAFGSRQEEAQRLGRILRPKPGENKAYFYTLVTGDSREQDFAWRRRMFLTEQGYQYAVRIVEPSAEEEGIL